MIGRIRFKNFRALRKAELLLSRLTLIVGPNGSGKSTALMALEATTRPGQIHKEQLCSVESHAGPVEVNLDGAESLKGILATCVWNTSHSGGQRNYRSTSIGQRDPYAMESFLRGLRQFSLDAVQIASPVTLQPNMELQPSGAGLSGVLDRLRDQFPERFEALNEEFGRWLPEFDHIGFDTPSPGQRSLLLRTREGGHLIPAADLSQGTLIALAILTLAYLPKPPTMVCLEEPDRGLHPRLLREVRDAMYRLAYPEKFGEQREPVQVIATTHSPYLLDLFRDHPEEIVIAEKHGLDATFQRLSDRPDFQEIIGESHLGEVWYSGVLGGVPASQ
jgi:predicted ATPase